MNIEKSINKNLKNLLNTKLKIFRDQLHKKIENFRNLDILNFII